MSDPRDQLPFSVWWLVGAGAVAMAVAGLYQFLWSSLRDPLSARLGASEAATGTVFTFFILFQTVSQFPFGWVREDHLENAPGLRQGSLDRVRDARAGVRADPHAIDHHVDRVVVVLV